MGNDNPDRELLLRLAEIVFQLQEQGVDVLELLRALDERLDGVEERLGAVEDKVQQ